MRQIVRITLLAAAAALLGAAPAAAQDFGYLGGSRITYNDALGDGDDRWQTGGAQFSFLFGPEGLDTLPDSAGVLWELRLRGQVISPDNFTAPAAWDRRAAGVLTPTINTRFSTWGLDVSAGAGLALTGPQTGLIKLQNLIHQITPANDPLVPPAVQASQIANGYYPTLQGEVARSYSFGEQVTLRPFVEAQAGVESLARVGADLFIGTGLGAGVLARDGTTGFTYQTLGTRPPPGISLTAGADTARVFDSALLAGAGPRAFEAWRHRVRAGYMLQTERLTFFQGVSWLSPEFAAQPEGQLAGVISFKWRF